MATKKTSDQKVMLKEPTKIQWASGSKFHVAGSTSMVHRAQAEKLAEAGKAKIIEVGTKQKNPAQTGGEGVDPTGGLEKK